MNKKITVTLNEKSHKHADMQINAIANPYLCIFVKDHNGGKWSEQRTQVFASDREYFLCHPNHEKACLHALNGGYVLINGERFGFLNSTAWHSEHPFMYPKADIRTIKQDPEYVKVESIFDLSRDERYYFRDRPGNYLIIEHATEDYILLQLNGGGLYRKVDQGE